MAVADKYQRQIRENAPVVYNGLTFHPLLVRDYGVFVKAKDAFELMLSSLRDPKLARLPWCACLWELDKECEKQTGTVGSFLIDVLCVMAMALRLDMSDEPGGGNFPLRPVFSQDGALNAIMIGQPHANYALLNMQKMSEIREILAAQNGYEIPDENWNPELVKAAQQNAGRGMSEVKVDFETLIYSVALHAHCRASEIYDWSIREFSKMQDAIDRSLGYQIYTTAEASGYVTFKKGNPYPSWKFDRKSEIPTGFTSVSELDAGAKGLLAGL